jgi:hypothetical protein
MTRRRGGLGRGHWKSRACGRALDGVYRRIKRIYLFKTMESIGFLKFKKDLSVSGGK